MTAPRWRREVYAALRARAALRPGPGARDAAALPERLRHHRRAHLLWACGCLWQDNPVRTACGALLSLSFLLYQGLRVFASWFG